MTTDHEPSVLPRECRHAIVNQGVVSRCVKCGARRVFNVDCGVCLVPDACRCTCVHCAATKVGR